MTEHPSSPEHHHQRPGRAPPLVTGAGFLRGARLALPVMPGMMAIALATGASAARVGLSFGENLVMCATMFASASQLVVFELWPDRFTPDAVLGLALIALTVNARMLLITASLRPWMGGLPAWIYPLLHLTSDPSWIVSMRYRNEGGTDAGVFFGASVLLASFWLCFTQLGFVLGALVSEPRRWGFDLIMPVFFAAMLVPLWRGRRNAVPWVVAGAVALAVERLVGGWYFIVAGAIAGAVTGGFVDDRRD
ncbi:MAG: AzlC family ABC transporter permease [Rhodoplanes sp.]|uniref:AzlC family ABC transporter permease n=1 Tax=Rhodoplanes sp. TaxID=1968906 RepID=UPI001845878B|nr:AzlC family ABC transporter permease [Rhodoplanes sp.]NVO17632.1 AzlC family ABC transporter permease [Rhodoplanes sp.]